MADFLSHLEKRVKLIKFEAKKGFFFCFFVLNVYFCCELRFVATYAPNSDFYSEIQELTQILLRISEEKIDG